MQQIAAVAGRLTSTLIMTITYHKYSQLVLTCALAVREMEHIAFLDHKLRLDKRDVNTRKSEIDYIVSFLLLHITVIA